MSGTKQIKQEDWSDRMVTFTNGNKGRKVSVVASGPGEEDSVLAENLPFMAIDYDPIKKGDDMIVSLGEDALLFGHTVEAPVEFIENQNDLGVVTSVEVIDQNDKKLILLFGA